MFFYEKFGRNDFSVIDEDLLTKNLNYIIKCIEKSGERLIFSKGLPQYFITDVLDEDVICPTGVDDRKIVLSDAFTCID